MITLLSLIALLLIAQARCARAARANRARLMRPAEEWSPDDVDHWLALIEPVEPPPQTKR